MGGGTEELGGGTAEFVYDIMQMRVLDLGHNCNGDIGKHSHQSSMVIFSCRSLSFPVNMHNLKASIVYHAVTREYASMQKS